MSDVSQGPGWWVASDGKWYPPQSAGSPAPGVLTLPAGPDTAQGPGWWQASDGKWYPPQPAFPADTAVKRPLHKRVWFWLLIIVALGFAGCVATVSVAGVAVDHFAHEHHTIVYSVAGTGQGAAITYETLQEGRGQNGSARVTAAALPWRKTITASGLITIYHVSAVAGAGGGSVSCTITDNGAEVAADTASGPFRVATCTWGG
jgi:hypothetical protein